eukprot:gene8695-13453_t
MDAAFGVGMQSVAMPRWRQVSGESNTGWRSLCACSVDDALVVFGAQAGAAGGALEMFVYQKGQWYKPENVSGAVPCPSVDFAHAVRAGEDEVALVAPDDDTLAVSVLALPTMHWTKVAAFPRRRDGFTAASVVSRHQHARVLIHGGMYPDTLHFDDTLVEVDLVLAAARPVGQLGVRPSPRAHHSAASAPLDTVVIHGGQASTGEILGDLWVFDLHTRYWREIPCGVRLCQHSVAASCGWIVLFGGVAPPPDKPSDTQEKARLLLRERASSLSVDSQVPAPRLSASRPFETPDSRGLRVCDWDAAAPGPPQAGSRPAAQPPPPPPPPPLWIWEVSGGVWTRADEYVPGAGPGNRRRPMLSVLSEDAGAGETVFRVYGGSGPGGWASHGVYELAVERNEQALHEAREYAKHVERVKNDLRLKGDELQSRHGELDAEVHRLSHYARQVEDEHAAVKADARVLQARSTAVDQLRAEADEDALRLRSALHQVRRQRETELGLHAQEVRTKLRRQRNLALLYQQPPPGATGDGFDERPRDATAGEEAGGQPIGSPGRLHPQGAEARGGRNLPLETAVDASDDDGMGLSRRLPSHHRPSAASEARLQPQGAVSQPETAAGAAGVDGMGLSRRLPSHHRPSAASEAQRRLEAAPGSPGLQPQGAVNQPDYDGMTDHARPLCALPAHPQPSLEGRARGMHGAALDSPAAPPRDREARRPPGPPHNTPRAAAPRCGPDGARSGCEASPPGPRRRPSLALPQAYLSLHQGTVSRADYRPARGAVEERRISPAAQRPLPGCATPGDAGDRRRAPGFLAMHHSRGEGTDSRGEGAGGRGALGTLAMQNPRGEGAGGRGGCVPPFVAPAPPEVVPHEDWPAVAATLTERPPSSCDLHRLSLAHAVGDHSFLNPPPGSSPGQIPRVAQRLSPPPAHADSRRPLLLPEHPLGPVLRAGRSRQEAAAPPREWRETAPSSPPLPPPPPPASRPPPPLSPETRQPSPPPPSRDLRKSEPFARWPSSPLAHGPPRSSSPAASWHTSSRDAPGHAPPGSDRPPDVQTPSAPESTASFVADPRQKPGLTEWQASPRDAVAQGYPRHAVQNAAEPEQVPTYPVEARGGRHPPGPGSSPSYYCPPLQTSPCGSTSSQGVQVLAEHRHPALVFDLDSASHRFPLPPGGSSPSAYVQTSPYHGAAPPEHVASHFYRDEPELSVFDPHVSMYGRLHTSPCDAPSRIVPADRPALNPGGPGSFEPYVEGDINSAHWSRRESSPAVRLQTTPCEVPSRSAAFRAGWVEDPAPNPPRSATGASLQTPTPASVEPVAGGRLKTPVSHPAYHPSPSPSHAGQPSRASTPHLVTPASTFSDPAPMLPSSISSHAPFKTPASSVVTPADPYAAATVPKDHASFPVTLVTVEHGASDSSLSNDPSFAAPRPGSDDDPLRHTVAQTQPAGGGRRTMLTAQACGDDGRAGVDHMRHRAGLSTGTSIEFPLGAGREGPLRDFDGFAQAESRPHSAPFAQQQQQHDHRGAPVRPQRCDGPLLDFDGFAQAESRPHSAPFAQQQQQHDHRGYATSDASDD